MTAIAASTRAAVDGEAERARATIPSVSTASETATVRADEPLERLERRHAAAAGSAASRRFSRRSCQR